MIVEDRFDEPKTISVVTQIKEAYERYLEHFDYSKGEPMDYEEYKDYWWRF